MQVSHVRMVEDVGTLQAHTSAAARLDMMAVTVKHGSTNAHQCHARMAPRVSTASASTVVNVTMASRARDVR